MMKIYNPYNIRIPIKVWTDNIDNLFFDKDTGKENLELEDQIINLTKLPFTFKHIALMPDFHLGYGMPIGGVLATKGVVIPNAVGSDIGCLDKDTEFLSPNGWIKISEYNNEKVMQFDIKTNKGIFVQPIQYIKEKCDKFIYINTKYGINQMLSFDHRCLVYKYNKNYKFEEYETILAKDLLVKHTKLKNGFRHRFLTSFNLETSKSLSYTEEQLRVIVMCCGDGNLTKNKIPHIVLHFKKEKKINRAKKLLKNANIEYTFHIQKNNNATFRFKSPIQKKILSFWDASYEQLRIIQNEVFYWDGSFKENCFYTRKKEEADFIQYVFSATGFRGVLRKDIHRDGKIDYRIFCHKNIKVGINGTPKTNIKIVKSKDGYKYCFTVPSSYLVLRRNGNVFITGNCGMIAMRTLIHDINKETLIKIKTDIKKYIPTGEKHHNKSQGWIKWYDAPDILIIQQELASAKHQLGTLGAGNHFIEIQKGDDGFIWIMIHSGSRNFGYKIAQHYHKVAKKLCEKWYSNIPNKDLSFLPISTPEAKEYIEAMNYALAFAKESRFQMMRAVCDVLSGYFPKMNIDISNNHFFDVHHNYAQWENHFGKNVIIHRKGATSARIGQIGIIPGSQGSKSYIVEGLGNPQSFMSCSHGAGRKMSRNDAKKNLNLEEEIKKLDDQGILHTIRGKDDLDEADGSYKDINVVMKNQSDLVKIMIKLTPLATIKGKNKVRRR
ncbi:hypothetical protein LCGC14_1513320 [marine sediment metagenome]|uniref:3'-phosphate/5'-hydroxy nucleic acid ligase n=1 Tax=marine sediment metagenome TaxID=412755 RepID=A0A0F9J0X2_9ZZZZ